MKGIGVTGLGLTGISATGLDTTCAQQSNGLGSVVTYTVAVG